MAATNAGPQVVPLHGREAMLGTNPLAIAVPAGLSHFFAAWHPDAVRPREKFLADVDDLIRSPRETAPGQTGGTVRVAGELEFAAEQDRRAHGVPVHPCVAVELEQIALKMAVPFPRRAGVHA
jgi:LDH2 family malate/lactate/ureidoglycolate dehydrogenase